MTATATALRRRRPPATPAQALQELQEAGYEPREPYPNRADNMWAVRCAVCGEDRSVCLGDIRRGQRCAHLLSPRMAEADMRAAGYQPLVPYPGSGRRPWLSRCTSCGQQRAPSVSHVRSGWACKHSGARRPAPVGEFAGAEEEVQHGAQVDHR